MGVKVISLAALNKVCPIIDFFSSFFNNKVDQDIYNYKNINKSTRYRQEKKHKQGSKTDKNLLNNMAEERTCCKQLD